MQYYEKKMDLLTVVTFSSEDITTFTVDKVPVASSDLYLSNSSNLTFLLLYYYGIYSYFFTVNSGQSKI